MRIIAVGCSFTYGQYLDTDSPACTQPSLQAWPNIVAQHFDADCVNMGWPGGSPRYCMVRLLDFQFQPGDVACILWPSIFRHYITTDFDRTDHWIDAVPDLANAAQHFVPQHKNYQRWWKRGYSNLSDRECDAWTAKHCVRLYLKDQGVPVVEYSVGYRQDVEYRVREQFATPWIPVFPNWNECYIDLARDNNHPGVKSHQLFAEEYIHRIQQGILE